MGFYGGRKDENNALNNSTQTSAIAMSIHSTFYEEKWTFLYHFTNLFAIAVYELQTAT